MPKKRCYLSENPKKAASKTSEQRQNVAENDEKWCTHPGEAISLYLLTVCLNSVQVKGKELPLKTRCINVYVSNFLMSSNWNLQ